MVLNIYIAPDWQMAVDETNLVGSTLKEMLIGSKHWLTQKTVSMKFINCRWGWLGDLVVRCNSFTKKTQCHVPFYAFYLLPHRSHWAHSAWRSLCTLQQKIKKEISHFPSPWKRKMMSTLCEVKGKATKDVTNYMSSQKCFNMQVINFGK